MNPYYFKIRSPAGKTVTFATSAANPEDAQDTAQNWCFWNGYRSECINPYPASVLKPANIEKHKGRDNSRPVDPRLNPFKFQSLIGPLKTETLKIAGQPLYKTYHVKGMLSILNY